MIWSSWSPGWYCPCKCPPPHCFPHHLCTGLTWQVWLGAAASENSALERLESNPVSSKSQDDENLSLCLYALAALSFLGLSSDKAFSSSRACVFSLAATIFPLVPPVTEPSSTTVTGTVKTYSTSLPSHSANSTASLVILAQAAAISLPPLEPEVSNTPSCLIRRLYPPTLVTTLRQKQGWGKSPPFFEWTSPGLPGRQDHMSPVGY